MFARPARQARLALIATAFLLVVTACDSGTSDGAAGTTGTNPDTSQATSSTASSSSTSTTTTTTSTTTTTMAPTFPLEGRVFGADGSPLRDAIITVGDEELRTKANGIFAFDAIAAGTIEITRPAYKPIEVEWDGSEPIVPVTMEPVVAKALRAATGAVRDDAQFAALLELAQATAVDAIVFDTKKEGGGVLYDTSVQEAHDIGAVLDSTYDPVERIEQAHAAGLYTITRIVSFEDRIRVNARPELKLAGEWIDPRNPEGWEYMLDLGVEACELGFDEVQFDYVRFPTGEASRQAYRTDPTTQEDRVGAIRAFLTEARKRIHPLGCAVGAAVFAIVFSSPDDQGIGQRPEDLAGVVDVLSPMIYPSHYGAGWLGFDDPNDHPGAVTADALDDGIPRIDGGTLVRPWLQAFYWTNEQILESIRAAERRGVGWMLWNAVGNYDAEALPDGSEDSADDGSDEASDDASDEASDDG